MKKLIVLIIMVLFLVSCGQSITSSEFLKHDSMYKNWDHMKFSWFGHNNPTDEEVQQSIDEQWWGTEIPYVAGE